MPRGSITKYEIESHLYRLKNELKDRPSLGESKYLADEYLNRVLEKLQEFHYWICSEQTYSSDILIGC